MAKLWEMWALDTWFFREGSPFNAGEGGYTGVTGCFPPYMNTLQGAIRTNLARGLGWTPEKQDSWPPELGNADDLGQLVLRGPYFKKGEEILFPAPLLLMRQKNRSGGDDLYTRLTPGGQRVWCDLGNEVSLPESQPGLPGAKVLDTAWLKRTGLDCVLRGGLPGNDQVLDQNQLWRSEYRVGIARNAASRTAADGQLYSCTHVRPEQGLSLVVAVSGIPAEWHHRASSLFRLGGEGRLAGLRITDNEDILPQVPEFDSAGGRLRFVVILATPALFSDVKEVIRYGPPGIPGRCVSACIGKLMQVGGWDMVNSCPRPLQPVVPAGSVWFYEAGAGELARIKQLQGSCMGEKTAYGYGQIVIGKWRGVI